MESLANSYGNGFDPALEWLLRGANTSPSGSPVTLGKLFYISRLVGGTNHL